MAAPSRNRWFPCRLLLGTVTATSILLAGCAQFPEQQGDAWKEQPSLEPQAGPQPSVEGEAPPPPENGGPPPEPPDRCHDPDPAVVASCLNPVGAIAVLPSGQGALVGERSTGRILRVRPGSEPLEIARIPVDSRGDGGLTGLALSPSFAEDELFYAYATTSRGNEVLRIAAGDRPKPVLSDIPKGDSGNSGALLEDGKGALLVATGNAGSPDNATDPSTLSGKVLRIDGFGDPSPDNPDPTSPIVASGLFSPGGLCGSPRDGTYWVTDRGGARDALYRIAFGRQFGAPAWTWADEPEVAGCAANESTVVIALPRAFALYTLNPVSGGSFTGRPTKVLENTFGRFSATALSPDGLLWAGTTNKAGGRPIPTDDRVVRIEPPAAGSTGKD